MDTCARKHGKYLSPSVGCYKSVRQVSWWSRLVGWSDWGCHVGQVQVGRVGLVGSTCRLGQHIGQRIGQVNKSVGCVFPLQLHFEHNTRFIRSGRANQFPKLVTGPDHIQLLDLGQLEDDTRSLSSGLRSVTRTPITEVGSNKHLIDQVGPKLHAIIEFKVVKVFKSS